MTLPEFWTNKWFMKSGMKGFMAFIYDDPRVLEVDDDTKELRINGITREVTKIVRSSHACEPDLGVVHSMAVFVKR